MSNETATATTAAEQPTVIVEMASGEIQTIQATQGVDVIFVETDSRDDMDHLSRSVINHRDNEIDAYVWRPTVKPLDTEWNNSVRAAMSELVGNKA